MKVLVVAGYCLHINSSANLCHISYIKGLLDCGHIVDLLTVSDKNLNIDEGIHIPHVRRIYKFDSSLYEQLGAKKSKQIKLDKSAEQQISKTTSKNEFKIKIKEYIRNIYGIYGTDIIWYLHAMHWKSDEHYDYVVSLSHPPVSHKLVEKLLKTKHLMAKKWIQIWEDPWYADIFGLSHNDKVKKEEKRLLSLCDTIYYVSPLTLVYQKKSFINSSLKMKWQPLPSYYESDLSFQDYNDLYCGYFGDYNPHVRNLLPFYNVANKLNIKVNICGNSSLCLDSTESIKICPRMGLKELKKYENQCNVLVFLCNLKGGQIPGKIYQYAATNKLILFILDGTNEEKQELYHYFSQFGRFVFCYNNEESIENAIRELKEKSRQSSYITPLLEFTPSNIMKNILEGK